MSKYIVGVVIGFGLSALLVGLGAALRIDRWSGSDDRRAAPVLGAIVACTQLLGELMARVISDSVSSVDLGGVTESSREVVLVAVVAFAIAGLVEDLLAPSSPAGHVGHSRTLPNAVLARRVALSFGASLGTVAYLWKDDTASPEALIDLALVMLCANAFMLLNAKSARCAKTALLVIAVMMLASGRSPNLTGVAVVAGSTTLLGLGELTGRLTLGSAGAGSIGAAVGVGIAMVAPASIGLIVVFVASLVAWMSETRRLEPLFAEGPLESFDRFGR